MLKNEHQALPLKPMGRALFGRIQFHYYKSGTGSGGMVNVSKVTNIVDGLPGKRHKIKSGTLGCNTINGIMKIPLTSETAGARTMVPEEMPPGGLSCRPRCQALCQTAIAVIGHAAGGGTGQFPHRPSFLSSDEKQMLTTVRRHFSKMIVLLNVGNID